MQAPVLPSWQDFDVHPATADVLQCLRSQTETTAFDLSALEKTITGDADIPHLQISNELERYTALALETGELTVVRWLFSDPGHLFQFAPVADATSSLRQIEKLITKYQQLLSVRWILEESGKKIVLPGVATFRYCLQNSPKEISDFFEYNYPEAMRRSPTWAGSQIVTFQDVRKFLTRLQSGAFDRDDLLAAEAVGIRVLLHRGSLKYPERYDRTKLPTVLSMCCMFDKRGLLKELLNTELGLETSHSFTKIGYCPTVGQLCQIPILRQQRDILQYLRTEFHAQRQRVFPDEDPDILVERKWKERHVLLESVLRHASLQAFKCLRDELYATCEILDSSAMITAIQAQATAAIANKNDTDQHASVKMLQASSKLLLPLNQLHRHEPKLLKKCDIYAETRKLLFQAGTEVSQHLHRSFSQLESLLVHVCLHAQTPDEEQATAECLQQFLEDARDAGNLMLPQITTFVNFCQKMFQLAIAAHDREGHYWNVPVRLMVCSDVIATKELFDELLATTHETPSSSKSRF